MGSYCPSRAQSVSIAFHGGRGLGCTGYTSPSTDPLEIFPMLLRMPKGSSYLSVVSYLSVFFEILNPGGPVISIIFFCFFVTLSEA